MLFGGNIYYMLNIIMEKNGLKKKFRKYYLNEIYNEGY